MLSEIITETKNVKKKIMHDGKQIEIEFQIKAMTRTTSRVILASLEPIRIKINEKETTLE